jgi:ABC-type antimicrobial peptide transport system permease subunit
MKTNKFPMTLIFALLFLGSVINNLRIFDIYLFDDVVLLKGILNQKEINLLDLTVKTINVSVGPTFYVITSERDYVINYTNQNYQNLLDILKKINYSKIETFVYMVDRYSLWFDIAER